MDLKTAEATIAGQDLGKNFQNPNLKPRVSLRIAGCLGIREHLGKMCNKFNAPSHCCGKLLYTACICDVFVSILGNLWTVFAMNYINLASEGKITLSGLLIYSKGNKTSEENTRMGKE